MRWRHGRLGARQRSIFLPTGSGAIGALLLYCEASGLGIACSLYGKTAIRSGTRCAFTKESFPQQVLTETRSGVDARWRAAARFLRSQALTCVDSFASAVFPSECAVCCAPLAYLSRAPVCNTCWADLPPQSGILCLHCGEALGAHPFASESRAPGDWLCRPCRTAPPAFDRAIAHGLYRGTLRTLLHLLKYDGIEPIAGPLGRYMAAQIAAQPAVPRRMTVVPVPLFAGKLRERGFNQAELLARAVVKAARAHGLTLGVKTGLLLRKRATESQAGLSPAGRRRNLQAAFVVAGAEGGAKPLAGRDLLLIDDIYTTGATARAASSSLRRAGAAQVWVATAARAQRQELAEPVHAVETAMEEDVASWG